MIRDGDSELHSPQQYDHDILDNSGDEIRLVRITDPQSTKVRLELQHAKLSETASNQYEALSYTWGDKHQEAQILINGKPFSVRQNLYQFLLQLKSACSEDEPHSEWYWIDQLSIDQRNILERNHQVSLMSQIYARASKVHIWLGGGNEDLAHRAMTFLNHLEDRDNNISAFLRGGTETHDKQSLRSLEQAMVNGWGNSRVNGTLKYSPKVELADPKALNALISNPYWTRLWIVQEIFLARTIVVQWWYEHTVFE